MMSDELNWYPLPDLPPDEGIPSDIPPLEPAVVDTQSLSPLEAALPEPPIHRSFTQIMVGSISVFVQNGGPEMELYTDPGLIDPEPPYNDRPRIMQQVQFGKHFVFVEMGHRIPDGRFPVYDPHHQLVIYAEPENTHNLRQYYDILMTFSQEFHRIHLMISGLL